jgi:glycosyltransferase involved in cell wall biosynthesis
MSDKVIYLFTISLIKGGAENQLVKLAIELKKESKELLIIGFFKHNDFVDILKSYNIKYKIFKITRFNGLMSFLFFFRKNKPDLIISFMYGANVLGRLVKFIYGIPLITSVRNNNISKKFYFLYKLSYKIDTISTFNSGFALNKFVDLGITNLQKSFLINNAINIPSNYESVPKKNTNIFTLTSIAHFRPQKDYKTLFHAIKILKDNGLEVRLFCLGHLYELTWPAELIIDLGLEDNIHLVGFVKSPDLYFKKSDAIVLSSLWEGTPNALLEAMAHKLPIISSEIPGCDDLVRKSKSGFLFKKESPKDLASKIKLLINSTPSQITQMSLSGHNYVKEHYAEKKVYESWKSLINKI